MKINKLITLTLCVSVLLSKPIITNVVKTEHSLTIIGKNFRSQNGKIIQYDHFENKETATSINGATPIIGNNWKVTPNDQGIYIDDTRSRSGSKAVKIDWSSDGYSSRGFSFGDPDGYSNLYISYWRWMEGDYNHKSNDYSVQFYLSATQSSPRGSFIVVSGSDNWGFYKGVSDFSLDWNTRFNINSKNWTFENTTRKFQRWEVFIRLNEKIDEYTGLLKIWKDGELGIINTNYRAKHADGLFNGMVLGYAARGFTDTAVAWYDDVYVSSTLSRVETSQDTNTNTVRDILPVLSWSSNSIEIPDIGSNIYVYVYDDEGNKSDPFLLSFDTVEEPIETNITPEPVVTNIIPPVVAPNIPELSKILEENNRLIEALNWHIRLEAGAEPLLIEILSNQNKIINAIKGK